MGSAPARTQEADPGPSFQDFRVRSWGLAEGLPDASITALLQTRDGYLWVGTVRGLARFDGLKFTPARLSAETNLTGRVTVLCEDAARRLWVGTQQDGLFCLMNGGFRQFRESDGLRGDEITCLAADAAGGVWVGTRAGLNWWDGGKFASFTTREGLPDDSVTGVHVGRSGVVFVTTRGGMCRIKAGKIAPLEFQAESAGRSPEPLGAYEDRQGNLWAFGDTYLININENRRFNYFRGTEAGSGRIWSLLEGADGRLWIGTSGRGLFCFDGNRFQPVVINGTRWQNDVRAIAEDHEGNLWLGTAGGGLAQLQLQPAHLFRTGQDLPAIPNCLATDTAGRLWVGLDSGLLYVRESGRFTEWQDPNGLQRQASIATICATSNGMVWAGTRGGGLLCLQGARAIRYSTANGLSDASVAALCEGGREAVWVGTQAGGLHRVSGERMESYGPTDGLSGKPITALLRAGKDEVWIGTENGGLFRGGRGHFRAITEAAPLKGKTILTLFRDASDRLWIGSDGGGLACLAGTNFHAWTTRNGLLDDSVYGVLEDADRSVWIVTGRGVSRKVRSVVERALAAEASLEGNLLFETEMSLPRPVHSGPRVLRTPRGVMWFATERGILMADEHVTKAQLPPAPVYLEEVIVNGQSIHWPQYPFPNAGLPEPVSASFSALRSLEVQFTAPSFTAPEQVRFRHKLEGSDADWLESGRERRVRYNRLEYGHYRFRVVAVSPEGGAAGNEASFAFDVPAPWWRRSWVMGLMGGCLLLSVAGVVRVASNRRLRRKLARLEQQQAMERERMRIARDMHDEIGSKLTKISFLSESVKADISDTAHISGRVDSIAHTSRKLLQTLDEMVWAVNPHNDTVENLAGYLGQYAGDYLRNTSVELKLNIARAIPHQSVSAEARHNLFLAFEEALNNVLKHAKATRVRLEMACPDGAFVLKLTDDGRGLAGTGAAPDASAKRSGNGLGNMHARLASVGGHCELTSLPGQGVTVIFTLPLTIETPP